MARLFLFAIGGTGARVVRSLTMQLAAGINGLDSNTQIVPIIIDYDLSNGDKERALDALESYSKIHSALYEKRISSGESFSDHFFMTNISSLNNLDSHHFASKNDFELSFGVANTQKTFADELNYRGMDGANSALKMTHELIESQYDDSEVGDVNTELNLDLHKGFKGNPNIGSVVFHKFSKDPRFNKVELSYAAGFNDEAKNDKIFIVSSIFGGTGSSGFPEIVSAIRNSTKLQDACIGAAIVLPYFSLDSPTQEAITAGDTGAIDPKSFNAKTKAALGAYSNTINGNVNAIYYIGEQEGMRDQYKYAEGQGRQTNDAHVVEFLAASAIIDFLKDNGNHVSKTDPNTHCPRGLSALEFAVKNVKDGIAINMTNFSQGFQDLLLDDLAVFAMAARYYREVLKGDRKAIATNETFYTEGHFNLASKLGRGVYDEFEKFLGERNPSNDWGYYHWMDELCKDHKHKLKLFNLRCVSDRDDKDDLRKILSHKTITVKMGWNPLNDERICSSINDESSDGPFTDEEFFHVLRKVFKKKYQNNK